MSPAKLPKVWPMNVGALSSGTWLVWVPTGGKICNVEEAGELHLTDRLTIQYFAATTQHETLLTTMVRVIVSAVAAPVASLVAETSRLAR